MMANIFIFVTRYDKVFAVIRSAGRRTGVRGLMGCPNAAME